MLATQKQAIESYRRVQAFLADHPPPESPGYLAQRKVLDDVVSSLAEHSVDQAAGRRLARAEVTRRQSLCKRLRELHLRPIAQIARATLSEAPGIEKALKMPGPSASPTRLVAEAVAMRTAAAQYEAQFVAAGRPADFLEQLDAAVALIEQSMLGQARSLGRQVGASAGIEREIKRGRRAVNVIDTIVSTAFADDQTVLAKWRSAKRVRAVPGGGVGGTEVDAPEAARPTPIAA